MREFHRPVLSRELIELLEPVEGGTYVDGTLGGGGHSAELLGRIGPRGALVGIDRDPDALNQARERLKEFGDRARLVRGNFRDLKSILDSFGIDEIDGAIYDLGVSSFQLDQRGFSFSRDEPLDMRMSREEDIPTAADIVNSYSETDLANVLYRYGDERYSRRIARAIVQRRRERPIETTGELARIISGAVPAAYRRGEIHEATRSFQALRIECNRELEAIEQGIPAAIELLKPGGRICAISFHSGEDRIVKRIFRRYLGQCECPPRIPECRCGATRALELVNRKPVVASAEEVRENPRSRSAKLRCAAKLG